MALQYLTGNSSTFVNTLMERFAKEVPNYIPKRIPLWNLIGDGLKKAKMEGEKYFVFPYQYKLNEAASIPSTEYKALPTPNVMEFGQGKVYLKTLRTQLQFTDEIVELGKKQAYAIVDALPRLVAGTIEACSMNRDFYLHCDASGKLGQSTGAAAGQVITLDSVRFLRPGMRLDGYDSTGNQDANSITIDSDGVSQVNKTITVTGTVSSVDSDTSFYFEDTYVASPTISTVLSPQGIECIINSVDPVYGDFQGMDRATKTYACAIVTSGTEPGTPQAFTLQRLITLLDTQRLYISEVDVPETGYCSLGVYNSINTAYRNEQQPIEFMPAKEGIPRRLIYEYYGQQIGIFPSIRALANTLFLISKKHIMKYVAKEFGWDTDSGIYKWLSGYAAKASYATEYLNFFTDNPQASARLNDITETT